MRRFVAVGARVVVMVGLVGAATACGGSEPPKVSGDKADPVIAVRDWNGYPASEVSGRLRLVEGCLLIGDSVAFWADGTSWDAATQSVTFESADSVQVGDQFSGGGGYYSRDSLNGLDGLDVDSVTECLSRTDSDKAVVATPPG